MTELDLKDRKLFYLLTENSRMKTSEMAARVGLSKNAVLYRIKRLFREGYVQKFLAVTDYHRIGVYSYDLFLRIRATEQRERAIRNYFANHPNIIWGTRLFGSWDFFIQLLAKHVEDFNDTLEDITIFLGDSLENYEVKFPVRRVKITQKIFDYEKETSYKYTSPKQGTGIIKLDELDKKILRYLSENGLAQFNEVAKRVGATMETTRNRMNALKKNGVIVKYTPMIGYDKLGMVTYLVIINFHYLNKESSRKILSYLNSNMDVKIIFETVGKQEIHCYVTVKSLLSMEKFVKDIRYKFYDIILSVDSILITEEFRLDFFPKALENL